MLRFLVANKFDHQKTYDCMLQHSEWRKNWLPVQPNDRTMQVLVAAAHQAQGLAYVFGRDNRFRPIIVIQVAKIDSLKVLTSHAAHHARDPAPAHLLPRVRHRTHAHRRTDRKLGAHQRHGRPQRRHRPLRRSSLSPRCSKKSSTSCRTTTELDSSKATS